MKLIPLTQGKFAMVDDEDFERVSRFTWRFHRGKNSGYARAWLSCSKGKRTQQLLHRFLFPDLLHIDHIDGNGLNNQRSNLRAATPQQNNQNARKRIQATSRFKGVCWYRKDEVWSVQIYFNQHQIFLGRYESETDAAHVYDYAAKIYFGEFARLNFP